MISNARTYFTERRHVILPWLILTVAAINVVFIGGKRRTFAVFISALHSNFTWVGRTELNWIGDSYTAVGFFLMPLCTNLLISLDRPYRRAMIVAAVVIVISCFSSSAVPTPGYMFLTHTALHGVGSTIILSTTALVVGEYFDKEHRFHVLATTLVTGGPYGALIFGPIYGNLVETFGWRTAFRVVGVLFFFEVMLGALAFIPKNSEYDVLSTSGEGGSHFITEEDLRRPKELNSLKKRHLYTVIPWPHLKANVQIFLWMIERVLHNIVLYSFMMNLVDFMTDSQRRTISSASVVNLLFGGGESVTFTIGVVFGDRLRGRLTLCYFIATLMATCLIFTAAYVMNSVNAMLTLAFFIGAFVGVGNTCVYAVSEEVMRIHGSVGFPSTKMMAAVGLFLAPQFSGFMIDAFGFQKFFICQGILTGCRCALQVAILFILHKKQVLSPEDGVNDAGKSDTKSMPPVTFTVAQQGSNIPQPPPYEMETDSPTVPQKDLLA